MIINYIIKTFLTAKFYIYTYVGVLTTILTVILLWLTIDIMGIPTLLASSVIIFSTFILKYYLYVKFKLIKHELQT